MLLVKVQLLYFRGKEKKESQFHSEIEKDNKDRTIEEEDRLDLKVRTALQLPHSDVWARPQVNIHQSYKKWMLFMSMEERVYWLHSNCQGTRVCVCVRAHRCMNLFLCAYGSLTNEDVPEFIYLRQLFPSPLISHCFFSQGMPKCTNVG